MATDEEAALELEAAERAAPRKLFEVSLCDSAALAAGRTPGYTIRAAV